MRTKGTRASCWRVNMFTRSAAIAAVASATAMTNTASVQRRRGGDGVTGCVAVVVGGVGSFMSSPRFQLTGQSAARAVPCGLMAMHAADRVLIGGAARDHRVQELAVAAHAVLLQDA